MRFKGLTSFNVTCFSCFTHTVTIRFNEFKRNKLHVSSVMIVTQKMFGYCSGLRAVTVVTLYHVDNVFGVAVNVMINKSSFAGRIKCVVSESVVYVIAC